ncbi:glucosylglycerol hydrolase [Salinigranum halophilum]|uniref:glucosylglycerol hydrolase n=1 Tax=Salinigranum halophilum TaxID=2565931 RepID=UPI0010A8977C|nr:glucosylglycerol hydrolase [Salinigranum halophilum]
MSQASYTEPTRDDAATAALVEWHDSVAASHDDDFEAAKELVTRLGAHYVDGVGEFGFWTPELLDDGVDEADVYLELLTPTEEIDYGDDDEVEFHRDLVSVERNGEYHWVAVEDVRAGTRDQFGTFYRLAYETEDGWETVADPLAYSVPFGAFAPAELYDWDSLDASRADREYFEKLGTDEERVSTTEHDGLPRVDPANAMVEIHPGTATEDGTLGGLARQYETIGEKFESDDELTPAERNFVGYDGIQLMPVEPLTENREFDDYWREQNSAENGDDDGLTVELDRPDMINWGYDIVVSAYSATNPGVLETGRPDELVDFIAACHNLPEPIKVVFDVALGHADNRGAELLNDYYFEGPGMYGKHLHYKHPTVRAVLLELQRRRMDYGADGIRVDGAQDFTYYDLGEEKNVHDDEFLAEMDEVTQEVAGTEYRPWMIFEDGRPWPREDWELASSYRALIEQHPHSFQWSPITFAHNTPALLTFWATKWWRVKEVCEFGSQWLTGVANHDTIRRGTQIDPTVEFNQSPVNPYLGEDYPETLDAAYNNPASSMFFYCFAPGVPMDFVHANMRAPWGFIRDTDSIWNVKVVSDESKFIYWQVREEQFQADEHFQRIKALGFADKAELLTFMNALSAAVKSTDYDLDVMAGMLSAMDSPLGDDLSAADLEEYAYAWMQDVHEFANLAHWHDAQDDERTAFDLSVREFRQERPWLRADVDFEGDEYYGYRHPTEGTVLYYGFRISPDGDEQLLFAANMEGVPVEVSPETLQEEMPDIPTDGWEVALAAPGVDARAHVELDNSQAIVWRREP